MKRLLNTLFVLTEDVYLKRDGENVVVVREAETLARYPLHTLEAILCFSYKGASPALMGACAQRGMQLSFLAPSGRFLACAYGEERGNVLLRKEQYRISDAPSRACRIARNMVTGKVYNARWVLARAARDHPQRVDVAKIKQTGATLFQLLPQIQACEELDLLRGLEGVAATRYFGVLGMLVLQNEDFFRFAGRNRRPPRDPINALLSFAYAMLGSLCASALTAVGLDAYVGFLHRDRPGRTSLALDLMEELRPVFADRFVLTAINSRVLRPEHFQRREAGATILTDEGKRQFLSAWQQKKQEKITHPFLNEQIPWGLVPYAQALLLSRHLRGDLDAYPAFLWK